MSERRAHLDVVAVVGMLACCILWGMQQVVVKATLPVLAPFLQAAIRSAIATVLLVGWSAWRRIPLFTRDGTLGSGLAAALLFTLEFFCIYAALPRTDAARVSVFIYLAPFVVALLLPRFEPEERLDRLQLAGLAAAFVALAFAFGEGLTSTGSGPGPGDRRWIGDALAIAAAWSWGGTTLVIRTTRLAHASAAKTLFYQLGVSAVLLYGAALASGERWPAAGLPGWAWLSLAFQSVVVAFGSYLGWFWLLRHYPATRLSAFSFLTPVFGLAFAAWLLGERIGTRLIVAMVFIAAGIALVNRRSRAIIGAP